MRRIAIVALLAAVFAAPAARAAGWERWQDFYSAVTTLRPDSTQVARVHSLLLERDACTYALTEGRLALLTPLAGRRVAAVFVGRGTMSFVPRAEIERQQVRRFYATPVLRRPIKRLTLIFADSTLAELRQALVFGADTLGALGPAWRATLPFLTIRHTQSLWPLSVAHALVEGDESGLFWSHATDASSGEAYFASLDPWRAERVRLERRPDDDRMGLVEFFSAEPVSEFCAAGDPDTVRWDDLPPCEPVRARIDVDLSTALDMTATAEFDYESRGAARQWLVFWLPPRLELDEVTAGGKPCAFLQEEESSVVWMRLPEPLAPGGATTVRMKYHGRSFERDANDRLYNTRDWYPIPDALRAATWDVTFHHPPDLQIVGAGRLADRREDGGRVHETWSIARPMPWTGFDPGYLRGLRVTGDSLPPVTVWSEHPGGAGRVRDVSLSELEKSHGSDEKVAHDVARAIGFYTRAWGAPGATEFNAVETPLSVYVALPGLIRMMPERDHDVPGAQWTPDMIRAHEIAHQWWGETVIPATYHDRWLSEGFANFSAIWYLQAGRRDADAYLRILEDWRHDLLENRHFLLGETQQAGPIWLGGRTNSSRTPGDYAVVIYRKGAWVLHMLRSYMLRDDDPGETRFRGMLRDFYQRFAGRRAFTEDFRASVEQATGEDMGWFFDQWVYGTDVPTYRFRWSASEGADHQWVTHVRIEQSDVPASFRMPVTLRLKFADGSFARPRVWVTGAVTELDLPPTPTRPADVVFNDLESVLCDVQK